MAPDVEHPAPRQPGPEPAHALAADGAGTAHRNFGDGAPDEGRGELARGRSRPPGAQARVASAGSAPSASIADCAAARSACFFELPTPRPTTVPTLTSAENRLACSGPCSVTT